MARNTLIKLRRGTGAPTSSTLNAGEPAVDTDTGRVYISTDGTDIVEVGSATASGNISGNLTVGGNTQVDGTVNVDGTTTLNGVTNTGVIATDTLTATGTVSGQYISSSGNINASGAIYASNYNPANLETAFNRSPIGLNFNTTSGLLDIDRQSEPDLTVNLDGRYLQYTQGLQSGQINVGTFTPTFADGIPGNTASFPNNLSEYGKYVSLKDSSGNVIASFITMFFSNGNTSGLSASNNVVIGGIPSAARPNYGAAAGYGDPYASIVQSWNGITQRSTGSQIATAPDSSGSNGEMQLIDFDSTGGAPLAVNKFSSGAFSLKIQLMLL